MRLDQLAGKVAVVTGGASGIGKAIAADLSARGMKVVIGDVEEAALVEAAAELGAVGVVTDVSSPTSMQALAAEAQRRFGAVHLFCSNAGVGSAGKIVDMSTADWAWLLNVNLWGAIHGIAAFLPLLNANPDGGHIVFTASVAGLHVTPGLGGYTVSKFALVALAETLALELATQQPLVRVTLLCPGPVRSHLGQSQRNRPNRSTGGGLVDSDLEATEAGRLLHWIDARDVSHALMQGIDRDALYVFTHPDMAHLVEERHRQLGEALRPR